MRSKEVQETYIKELYESYCNVVKTGTSLILNMLLIMTSCKYINLEKIQNSYNHKKFLFKESIRNPFTSAIFTKFTNCLGSSCVAMSETLHQIKENICFNYQLNEKFLYSMVICMLHYNPQHVSSSTMLIIRRSYCIITASGIVTLCKRPYSTAVESGLTSAVYRVTIPDAVIIQFDLLKMSIVLLETC